MAGSNYERQSSLTNGITINASLFNSEFNQLLNAFRYSSTDSAATGHRHDGAAGQGANIYRVGDTDFKNKIEVDETNNRHGFFVEVGAAAVEQVRIQDGLVVPVTTNDIDLGSSSLEFKNIYARNFTSSTGVNANGGLTVALNTNLTVGTTLTMSSDGTDTTINEIGDGKLLVGANEYIFRTSDGSTSAVDATPTELNRMVLSSGDTGGVFIYGGNASPVATDTGYANHTAAFYSNGGLALSSSASNGGWFSCQNSITITDVDGGTESFPDIHLKRNSPSPADADNLGSIEFWGNRVGGTTAASKYGQVRAQIENVQTGVGKIVLLPHDGTGAINAVGFSMGTFEYSGVDGAATNTKAGGVLRLTSADDTTLELSALDSNVFSMSGGLNVTGTVTADGVKLGDNEKIQLGNTANPDLEIYHNGSHSVIDVTGTGNLILSGAALEVKNSDNNVKIVSEDGATGAVKLSHGNTQGEQLATTATGINVTGELTTDSIRMGTDQAITFNTDDSNYSQLKRTAAGNTFLSEVGSGEMIIQGENLSLRNAASAVMYKHDANAAELYHRNGNNAGLKLQTTNTGIDVTGVVTADGLTLGAGEIATFNSGDGGNLQISGDATGSFSLIKQTAVGDLFIQAQNGHLRNDANDSLVAWDGFKAELYWRGASGAGAKLATTATGIDVTGAITADDQITITSNSASASAQPALTLISNETASIDNQLGEIVFQGHNAEQDDQTYAYMRAESSAIIDDQEEGKLKFVVRKTGNAYINTLTVDSAGIDVTGDLDVTGAVKSTKGFYTDYKNHGDFPTTDSWYTIAICKGRDAATTIQRASGEFVVVDNTDSAGHETTRFTASELFAQDALISVSEYLSYSSTTINRFRIKSGAAFEGSALQVYASSATADLGVTLINDPYLQSNEGGWRLLDAPVIDSSDPSTLEGAGRTLGFTVGTDSRAWDWANFTSKADTGFLNNPTGLTTTSGVSVGGNLDVTGTITSNAFAHSKALVVETGSLSTSEFLAHAGKRIVKTGATTSVYSLPQPVAADIGKTWIIANASGTKATIDHDASGTAQNIWILDGVTLTAKEADWELKKGSITEIACVAAEAAGGSAAAANYIIYGAGVIEV